MPESLREFAGLFAYTQIGPISQGQSPSPRIAGPFPRTAAYFDGYLLASCLAAFRTLLNLSSSRIATDETERGQAATKRKKRRGRGERRGNSEEQDPAVSISAFPARSAFQKNLRSVRRSRSLAEQKAINHVHASVRKSSLIEGLYRHGIPEYPQEEVREAIVNDLAAQTLVAPPPSPVTPPRR
jgi:hypothetical protein